MKTVYLIRTLNLIGATFNMYSKVELKDNDKIVTDSNGIRTAGLYQRCRYYKISETPIGYDSDSTELLPYFAKLTQDLPASCKFEPEIHERCQLTNQTPNNYLVFRDLKTGEDLKIALNSYSYSPIN